MDSSLIRPPCSGNNPNQQLQTAYLDYAPTHTGNFHCYTSWFERLGFKITASTALKRDMLISHLKAHVGNSVYAFLRSTDSEAAFNVMVSEFLAEHGQEYWGLSNREHLAEPDDSKGFLYPRDANREGSRLIIALQGVFEYRAKSRVGHMAKKYGQDWISKNVDYKAMTGRKADASAIPLVVPHPTPKPYKRRLYSEVHHENYDEDESEDIGNDKEARKGSWNVFDEVETKTRLRPSPSVTNKWRRHVSHDEQDGHLPVQQSKVKKRRPPMPAPGPPEPINAAKPRKEVTRTTSSFETPVESGSDSEQPLSHKRRQRQPQPFTPPVSHAPSITPAISNRPPVIDLDSSPERELPQKQISKHKPTSFKTETNSANIKGEPISPVDRARTILLVTASNEDKAPITVPFATWKKSEDMFTALIQEQGLRPESGKKVKEISATYTWNKTRRRLRRGNTGDWDRFLKTVQKAWELESDKFEDECEIEMVLHVDE